MLCALITALALLLPTAAEPQNLDASPAYDTQAEQRLLELTNQERQKAGAPALQPDPGLTGCPPTCRSHSFQRRIVAPVSGRAATHETALEGFSALKRCRRERCVRQRRGSGASGLDALAGTSRQYSQSQVQRRRLGGCQSRGYGLHNAGFRPQSAELSSGRG